MPDKKYELTDETTEIDGHTLHRIKALRDFGKVKKGDLGGFIEKEENLSHEGECWVYNDAKVYEEAQVTDDAIVYVNARVYGNAEVCNDAQVSGVSEVYGNARVVGEAKVTGKVSSGRIDGKWKKDIELD